MNWGGFAGGFSQGFNNGVAMGKTISQAIKDKKLEDIRAQGIAEANAAREQAVANSVRENSVDSATPATAPNAEPAQPELTSTPQASPAPDAKPAVAAPDAPAPAAAPSAPPPVDASLEGAPAQAPKEPALTSTPQATPAPKEPVTPPAAQGISTPEPKARFTVNGKGFATREDALKYARDNAPDVMDFMHKTLVPKMQQAFLEQGDIEKAEAWGKWAKDKKNEKHMEAWANAFKAYQAGDFVTSAQNLVKMHGDLPDGNTIVGADPVKDKDGNVTGFNMKVKNDATGETRAQFVDPKTLTEAGLGALSPDKMFSTVFERQKQADLLSAKARIDEANDNRTFNREITKQKYIEDRADKRDEARDRRAADKDARQHGYKLEELTTQESLKRAGYGAEEKAKLQAKIDVAREAGANDDEIKTIIRHNLGGDVYKKTTDPTERRALMISDLMKNSPGFATAKPEKQQEQVDRMMTLTYGEQGKPAGGAGATTQSNPFAVGSPAPAGLKDGAYKDSKTGQPFRVQGGKIVPLK